MKKFRFLSFAGFLGVLGILVPIGWEHYKTRVALEVRVVDSGVVFSKPKEIDGLKILYNGESLNALYKLTLMVKNSGRTPIKLADVASPLVIVFPSAGVIEAAIEQQSPKNLGASIKFDRSASEVTLDFALLNSDDYIVLRLLSKNNSLNFDAGARVAGLSDISIFKEPLLDGSQKHVSWVVWPIGIFSVFLLLVALGCFVQYPHERRTRAAVKNGTFSLPLEYGRDQFIRWVGEAFKFATRDERKRLTIALADLPDDSGIICASESTIRKEIDLMLESSMSNLKLALGMSAMGVSGLAYVVSLNYQ